MTTAAFLPRQWRFGLPRGSFDGLSPEQAVAAVREVQESIGDSCPECPDGTQRRLTN
jgi:hypothetical protein